jgi:hypothetical protein
VCQFPRQTEILKLELKMTRMQRNHRIASRVVVPLAILACLLGFVVRANRAVRAGQATPPEQKSVKLGASHPGSLYAVTLAVKDIAKLQGTDAVQVKVNDAQGEIASKWLHPADLDFYLTVRPRAEGPVTVSMTSAGSASIPEVSSTISRIAQGTAGKADGVKRGVIAAQPNDTWQVAQPFELGQ